MDDFERTKYSDDFYGILGRALVIATRFQQSLRMLAILFKIKENPLIITKPDIADQIIENINKFPLGKNLLEIVGRKFNKGESELADIIKVAIEARNKLIHEIPIGLDHLLDNTWTEKDFDDTVLIIKQLLENIIKADYLICCLLVKHNKESFSCSLPQYTSKINNWIFTIEE